MAMAAIAYNLKKLIKHTSRLINDGLQNMQIIINKQYKTLNQYLYLFYPKACLHK